MIYAVIGSNFGDEGKGLATDYLSALPGNTLVIRHNGGAQSGHTVEVDNGLRRFVFHELSSGSFRHADTYWADSFYPDMYKLDEEIEAFHSLEGFFPCIYASVESNITTIDDILLNMLYESSRKERHGSCGMGIYEADLRKASGYGITVGDLAGMDVNTLYARLTVIRHKYTEYKYKGYPESIYTDMLNDENVLRNFAKKVIENRKYITVCEDEHKLLSGYDNVIFEGGQGLELDSEKEENLPHVTASRTGLTNVVATLDRNKLKLDEVVYVTRSYLTRHGAGPLANEDASISEKYGLNDKTNMPNEWQGTLRYARWTNPEEMIKEVIKDIGNCPYRIKVSQFITHLNETENKILFKNGDMKLEDYIRSSVILPVFDVFYLSKTPFSKDCEKLIKHISTDDYK